MFYNCVVVDRYGRRPMLLAGIGATFFMIILFGLSRSFAMAGTFGREDSQSLSFFLWWGYVGVRALVCARVSLRVQTNSFNNIRWLQ